MSNQLVNIVVIKNIIVLIIEYLNSCNKIYLIFVQYKNNIKELITFI